MQYNIKSVRFENRLRWMGGWMHY